jgi:LysM repeat protein
LRPSPRAAVSRRRVLAGLGGVAASALIAPRSLLAGSVAEPGSAAPLESPLASTAATAVDLHHYAWIWQFRHDGDPGKIRDTLAEHGLGIALKTHDGVSWMSRYDPTPQAVSGPRRIESYANYFEQAGVPFHAWAVVKGTNPAREAQLASDVLNSGARTLILDLEAHAGFWVGSRRDAASFGQALRRLQPSARLSTSIDPRPWEIDRIPLAEFAAFTDEITPQVYWKAFSSSGNVQRYRSSGFAVPARGITPTFVISAMMQRLRPYRLPVFPIGDGTVPTRSAWVEFIDSSYDANAESVSVWRYGVAHPSIFQLLRDTPPRPVSYVVQRGDTLSVIAARLNTTVAALVQANGIANPNVISVGTRLRLPSGSAAAAAPAPAPEQLYTVRSGDTLSGIALRYGASTSALMSRNGINNPNLLRVGQQLVIPAGVGAGTPAPVPAQPRTHVVQAGDTLIAIAVRYGSSSAAIASANGITNRNLLRLGQRLVIP